MKATIDLPDLPNGWDVIGHIYPKNGQMYLDGSNKWCVWDRGDQNTSFITAKREQNAAEWANDQPKLGMLASILYDNETLCLSDIGQHEFVNFSIRAEECPSKFRDISITIKSGKWVECK